MARADKPYELVKRQPHAFRSGHAYDVTIDGVRVGAISYLRGALGRGGAWLAYLVNPGAAAESNAARDTRAVPADDDGLRESFQTKEAAAARIAVCHRWTELEWGMLDLKKAVRTERSALGNIVTKIEEARCRIELRLDQDVFHVKGVRAITEQAERELVAAIATVGRAVAIVDACMAELGQEDG